MADDVRETVRPYQSVRVRREDLLRPADRRRDFTSREAQRRLQQKERPHWALFAYAVFAAALLFIFGVAYTTYAFSLYRGVILPGVRVDHTSLAGLNSSQAEKLIDNQLAAMYWQPLHLVSPVRTPSRPDAWDPSHDDIGYYPEVKATVQLAEQVGRQGSFFEQLLDRLPVHPEHNIPLLYTSSDRQLRAFILRDINPNISAQPVNAGLQVNKKTFHVDLVPSRPGMVLDVPRTIQAIHRALGSLTKQSLVLPVNHVRPVITNAAALRYRDRIESFLAHPPVIGVGKRVFVTSRRDFAPMFSFKPVISGRRALIEMLVNADAVTAYVRYIASLIDRPPQDPKFDFSAGRVNVITPRKAGRTLDQATANQRILAVINALKPNARIRFPVTVTQPAVDTSNPASLGIDTLLGMGGTSFMGAPEGRLHDVQAIASHLNDDLISPDQDISFNTLVGTGWASRVYQDKETEANGQLVPGRGGAMQQVASTFFRALYASGLKLLELHNHTYRLPWYEPPYGQDAVVSPGYKDLVFHNDTGKYLLIQTRVEPIRQELYVYLYGPHLKWRVNVDKGKIVRTYPHGPQIVKQDPSLSPGDVVYQAWPHDGADVVVHRTIVYANGNVKHEKLSVHYQPWQEIVVFGGALPTATPNPTAVAAAKKEKGTPGPRATPVPSPTLPAPTPTPTFNH